MAKQYSIAEARDRLSGIVHEVEEGQPVELTRRGKPVAVVMSFEEYKRRTAGKPRDFWEAVEEFRRTTDLEGLAFTDEELKEMRDRSSGRDFRLD